MLRSHTFHKGAETQGEKTFAPVGLVAGSEIATADGLIPVEFLEPGDRIVTRAHGFVALQAVGSAQVRTGMVYVAPGALGENRPAAGLQLPAGQTVLLRGWRSMSLFRTPQSVVPVGCTVDGGAVIDLGAREVRMFRLQFPRPEVIYVNGLEIAIKPRADTLSSAA